MHLITFTIGDWSADGHEQSEDFVVASSLPVKELRELHFAATPLLGFGIGEMCEEVDTTELTAKQVERLRALGALDASTTTDTPMTTRTLLDIWLCVLRAVARHQGIELTLEENITTPTNTVPFDAVEALMEQAVRDQGLSIDVSFHGQPAANPLRALLKALKKAARDQGRTLGVTINRTQPHTIPTFHFYGVDDQGRHLDVPGYGVFTF